MKTAKKLLAFLLTLALLCALFGALPVHAKTALREGQCGDNVYWALDSAAGTLTISGTGPMWDQEPFGSPWGTWVVSVEIEDGVTAIGENSFLYCTGLTEITLPASIRTIGREAFQLCGLTSLTLPEGVTGIGALAFDECPLERLSISGTVTQIGDGAFNYARLDSLRVAASNPVFYVENDALYRREGAEYVLVGALGGHASFRVPDGVTAIGGGAFRANRVLETVTLPGSVTAIGAEAFFECGSLREVRFSDGLKTIGNHAFADCQSLSEAVLPATLTSIGDEAFSAAASLRELTLPEGLRHLGSRVFWSSGLEHVVIPASLAECGEEVFYFCYDLSEVTLADGLTSIGGTMFTCCSSLTHITIPESVTTIGARAFYDSGLAELTIPAGVSDIGESAFAMCDTKIALAPGNPSLSMDAQGVLYRTSGAEKVCLWCPTDAEEITIPDGVTSIGGGAFCGCPRLCRVTLPDTVTEIENNAFLDCLSLTDVRLSGNLERIGGWAFGECASLSALSLPDSIRSIGEYAIKNSGITSLDIPKGMTAIGDYAFAESPLSSVTIPDTVTSIGILAFDSCPFTSIHIPDSVKTIGSAAFLDSGLTQITLPEGLTEISDHLFYSCDELTDITIPETVTKIGSNAFSLCLALEHITLPKQLTEIEEELCVHCSALKTLEIPEGVTRIGQSAFRECEALEEITIPASVTQLRADAFSECRSLKRFIVDAENPCYFTDAQGILYYRDAEQWICVRCPAGLHCAVLPEGVTGISDDAISSFGDLTMLSIPGSVKTIEPYAFWAAAYVYEEQPHLREIFYAGSEEEWLDVLEYPEAVPNGIRVYFGIDHPDCPSGAFLDAPLYDNWAHEGIDYCIANEYMNGVGNEMFNPGGTLTRAQLVTILYRIEEEPAVEFKGTFSDVPDGQWYSAAIEWAAANGIVNGVGEGRFNPTGAITREQIAAILYRYAGSPEVSGSLDAFPDSASVRGYAADALVWATGSGLINGIRSGAVTNLAPQRSATRAQIATIIMRYLEGGYVCGE